MQKVVGSDPILRSTTKAAFCALSWFYGLHLREHLAAGTFRGFDSRRLHAGLFQPRRHAYEAVFRGVNKRINRSIETG